MDADSQLDWPVEELLSNDFDEDGDELTIIGFENLVNCTVTMVGDTISIVPAPGFLGTATFDYIISDGQGGTATARVEVVVREPEPNSPPVAGDDAASTAEDTPLVLSPDELLANDSDPDGDGLNIVDVGSAVNGTVSIDEDGNVVFTPDANYSGPASFVYTVEDANGASATATVEVTVVPGNASPVAVADLVTAMEDTPLVMTAASLLANDHDADGDNIAITSVGDATMGTVAMNGGNIVFTPVANYNGPASFTYTVSDGQGGTSTGTVYITVVAVNDAPVAANNSVNATEDTPLVMTAASLLANDSDVDGDSLTITGVGNATHGTVAMNGGNVEFTPAANYNGPASFTYTVSDGQGGTSTATVNVTVAAVNDAPVAASNSVSAMEDTPLVMTAAALLANDSDVDGDSLTITGVGNATHGTVAMNGGNVEFTPAANYNGPASFTYTVSDGQGGTSTATVNVTVAAVNDAPVAANNSVNASEDTPLVMTAASLLANDSDVDGDSLTITSVGNATHGTVALNGGNIVFTPAANYNGPASFTYTVSDGQGGTSTATVNITVAAVNDSPVAANNSVSATEDTPLVMTATSLLANDSDVDADSLTVTSVGNATNGTVALNGGNIVFTPAANYNGPASFTYTVSDGQGGTSTATVNITVAAVNDSPVAANNSVAATEDTPLVMTAASLLANDSDVDGDSLTITGVGNATNGTVALNGGNVVFTPASNYNGPASFTYTISDGHGGTSTATVNVTVAAVNDSPVGASNSVSATEDTPLVMTAASLLANDSDVDGDSLTITGVGNATNGTVALNGGNVVFTPAANYNGLASFTYTVSDGHGGTSTATVNVTVAAVNDAPTAVNDSVSATEDTPLVLTPATLLANDGDVEGNSLTITGVGNATHGNVALNGGNVVFTPTANYSGPASFTYTVSDGQGGTSTATVSVNVVAQGGAAPEIDAAPAAGSEDAKIPLSISCDIPAGYGPSGVSILISGVPAGASLSAGTNLGGGTWSLTVGQLTGLKLTPPANSGADFALTVTATGNGGSTTTLLPVAVAAMADAPKMSVVTPTVVTTKGLVVKGTDWSDRLYGGAGGDTISGGKGDDVIVGDRQTRGGSAILNIKAALTDLDGSETLTIRIAGLPPCASLSAGTRNADGSWTLTVNQLNGLEVLFPAGTPAFTLTVTATATDVDPNGGAADTESVTATIQVKTKPEGNDVLRGGDGNDEIWGTGGNDTMAGDNGNDYLSGGKGNDAMTGDAGNDLLQGRDGNDTLSGGTGHDGVLGDEGNDRVSGGDGNDWLSGGEGNDKLLGDAGNDEMSGGSGADTMAGGDGNDWVSGGSGNDNLSGDKGNDDLSGGDGNDTMAGGDGHDDVYGGSGNDNLSGGNDNDELIGGSGNDVLSGGGAKDWIEGGSGADTLSGGADGDRFVFNGVGEGIDVITDFRKGDVIDIEDVLSGCIDDGGDAVDDGFVRFVQSGGDTLVQVDRNGGGNGFQALVVLKNVAASTLDADDVLAV
jgi:Ca2+-binding RTX toxin-like protein